MKLIVKSVAELLTEPLNYNRDKEEIDEQHVNNGGRQRIGESNSNNSDSDIFPVDSMIDN